MARGSHRHVPNGQLSFLPSADEDVHQAETLQSAREPDCSVQPETDLPRHACNMALGDRTPAGVERLRKTLKASGHAVYICTLDGQVLSDWDAYRIAIDESLPIHRREYDGDDPAAFVCIELFHGPNLNKSLCALRVVQAFPCAERGRPKKPVENTGFSTGELTPRTAPQMADLADCSPETIRQARRVHTFGLTETVLAGHIKFSAALRHIKDMREEGLTHSASSQPAPSDESSPTTQGSESDIDATPYNDRAADAGSQTQRTARAQALALEEAQLTQQVHALQQAKAELIQEVETLMEQRSRLTEPPADADAARLRAQITKLEARLHSQEERTRRAERRADAAEAELERLRQQLQRVA